MSLHLEDPTSAPEETRRVARAAFPKGTLCLDIADALGAIYQDSQFTALFSPLGQPALTPARLALERLLELGPGHEVRVADAAGDVRVYRVDRVADHPVDDFPTLEVYGAVAGDEVRLITCTGVFDTVRDQYLENRVVYASRSG